MLSNSLKNQSAGKIKKEMMAAGKEDYSYKSCKSQLFKNQMENNYFPIQNLLKI